MLADVERTMLERLAVEAQRTASDWLRVLIRREHAERFPARQGLARRGTARPGTAGRGPARHGKARSLSFGA